MFDVPCELENCWKICARYNISCFLIQSCSMRLTCTCIIVHRWLLINQRFFSMISVTSSVSRSKSTAVAHPLQAPVSLSLIPCLLQKSLNFCLHCLVDYDYAQAKINDSGFSKDITCTIGPNLQIRNHSEEVCVQHKRIYWHLIHWKVFINFESG